MLISFAEWPVLLEKIVLDIMVPFSVIIFKNMFTEGTSNSGVLFFRGRTVAFVL